MLISPLAKKLCAQKGIDPAALRGTGPRGRIMAADVTTPAAELPRRGETVISDFATPPTRPVIDGYYVYDHETDMSALARISFPIAVQCEKLLENRYTLFDYIVRAVVKACTGNWAPADGSGVDVLLFQDAGRKVLSLSNAATKTIYQLAKEAQNASPGIPEHFQPHIAICDAATTRQQVVDYIASGKRPTFGFVARGGIAKAGIRAGAGELPNHILPYTLYISTQLPQQQANRIAARLGALLYNPVSLLLPS